MLASELIKTYEEFCPQELSMEGDVVGLQIGSLDKEIQKVMVTLDVRENTVAEAIEKGVDLIIAKHAPIFRPVKDLVSSPDRDILLDLVKHDIAVYVSHMIGLSFISNINPYGARLIIYRILCILITKGQLTILLIILKL